MNRDHSALSINTPLMPITSDLHPYIPNAVFQNSNSDPNVSVGFPGIPPFQGSTCTSSTTPTTNAASKKAKPAKIRRPCNSFFLYLRDKQIEMEHVLKEKPRQNMTKIVGELWKQETEELRSIYKAMADEIKLVHLEHYPGYKYQPEKKIKKK